MLFLRHFRHTDHARIARERLAIDVALTASGFAAVAVGLHVLIGRVFG